MPINLNEIGKDVFLSEAVKPERTFHRINEKCSVCGKVAKEKSRIEVPTREGNKILVTLECNHILFLKAISTSPFETLVFDGIPDCKHEWNKTICTKCNAKRLFPFQIAGAIALEKANGRFGIFDEMGLGKTIQKLAHLYFHPELRPFLWVTKSGIKFQHAKEIMRVLGRHEFPQILMSGKDTLIPGMNCIASYSIFRRLDLDMFAQHGFKDLTLDECQNIKNPGAAQTQCIQAIAKHIDGFTPLSGTPWKNRGGELFTVYNMLDPRRFPSEKRFKDEWVDTYFHGNRPKEGGIANPAKFREYTKDLCIRRERIEVMPELPLISRNKLICEVEDYAKKAYQDEENKLIATYNDAILSGEEDSFATHQAIMQSLIVMRQILGIAKVPTTVEFVQEFLEETSRKMVVFVHHKECGKLITSQLSAWGRANHVAQPLTLTADLSSEERFAVQERFNGPNVRLLIASTLASGEGLNLQTCSDCVMHERQWNPANEEQAEGRFIRIGQLANAVTATYIHADDSVDMDLDSIVEAKRIAFHKSMNKGELHAWNESSIIKGLAERIAGKRK